MKGLAGIATTLVLALLLAAPSGGAATGHPVSKVIQLLHGLKKKAVEEGQDEELLFTEFQRWCGRSLQKLGAAVTEGDADVKDLTQQSEALGDTLSSLEGGIKDLEDQIMGFEKDGISAKKQRGKEEGLYNKAHKDLGDTISAVGTVIKKLGENAPSSLAELKRPEVYTALTQVTAHLGDKHSADMAEFLQALDPADLVEGDRDAHVQSYKFKSGNVVEMFKDLKSEFEDNKRSVIEGETNTVNSYNLAKAAREDLDASARESMETKKKAKDDATSELATVTGDLKSRQDDFQADSQEKETTESTCSIRTSEWQERSKLRTGEMEAIEVSIKILAKVADVTAEAPSHLQLADTPVSFLQVTDPKMKALNLLRATARTTHSKALEQLAQQLAVHLTGPMDEIVNMIEKMIFRLMDEQKEEDEHKNWCDQEVEKTTGSLDRKTEKSEAAKTDLDELVARAAMLAKEIEKANTAVSDLKKSVRDATDLRTKNKAENGAALKDAEDAQNAIAEAVSVLNQFYKESGGAAALLQEPVKLPEKPAMWDASYTGVADPKAQPGGIVNVLEELAAKFSQMGADCKAQEAAEENAYDEEISASKIDAARHMKAAEMKVVEKRSAEEKASATRKKKKSIDDEKEDVQQYMKDLEPACKHDEKDYESRKEARKKEMDALREAEGLIEDVADAAGKPKEFLAIRAHVASK